MASDLSRHIVGLPRPDAVEWASKLLQNQTDKKLATNTECAEAILGAEKLVIILAQTPSSTPNVRQQRAALLTDFLGQIRNAQIPNFEPRSVVANVSPPEGVPGFAGMDPNTISDPVARSKYLDAIAQNEKSNQINKWQAALRRVDVSATTGIVSYLSQVVASDNVPQEVVDQWAKQGKLQASERNRITEKRTP